MNGSAFSTYVAVSGDDFQILKGCPKSHKVSEQAEKCFCGECGTPIFNLSPKYEGLIILHLGSIDDALDIEPIANIYCESQLDWLHKLPEMPSLEKGFD